MGSSTYKPTILWWAQRQQFSFANIFVAYFETQSLSKIVFKAIAWQWKRDMNDIFSLWDISKPEMVQLSSNKQSYIILPLNLPPKFTETMFLDTVVYKGQDSTKKLSLMFKGTF